MVQRLGANQVFDYKDQDFVKQVEQEGRYIYFLNKCFNTNFFELLYRYHIILDGAKMGHQNIPKTWQYETYITLNSPLLINTDKYGLLGGLVYSVNNLLEANLSPRNSGGSVKWGFFVPYKKGFEFINELIHSEQVSAI